MDQRAGPVIDAEFTVVSEAPSREPVLKYTLRQHLAVLRDHGPELFALVVLSLLAFGIRRCAGY